MPTPNTDFEYSDNKSDSALRERQVGLEKRGTDFYQKASNVQIIGPYLFRTLSALFWAQRRSSYLPASRRRRPQ